MSGMTTTSGATNLQKTEQQRWERQSIHTYIPQYYRPIPINKTGKITGRTTLIKLPTITLSKGVCHGISERFKLDLEPVLESGRQGKAANRVFPQINRHRRKNKGSSPAHIRRHSL